MRNNEITFIAYLMCFVSMCITMCDLNTNAPALVHMSPHVRNLL